MDLLKSYYKVLPLHRLYRLLAEGPMLLLVLAKGRHLRRRGRGGMMPRRPGRIRREKMRLPRLLL
jgi:hypothetical protein